MTYHFTHNVPKAKNDIDLLLIGTPKIDQVSIFVHNIESSLQREIMFTIINSTDFKSRKQKLDPFIWNVLEKPNVILIGNPTELYKGFLG
jgi:hypothetical protein